MRILCAFALMFFSLMTQASDTQLNAALEALKAPQTVLIDVRTQPEFAAGPIAGATRIGHEQIARQISQLSPDKDTPIVLYCRSGSRSGIAQNTLQAMGYRNVVNAGGYEALAKALESQP
ncbi:MAG: sulfurtransferase [Pseudomonadaceae bacterium]|nr:sulfurtransferase [Pseudomonadaceae bacterium]